MKELTKEAVKYAKGKKELNRIFKEILNKYKSVGRFSGYIILSNITEEESRVLGAVEYKLFGKKEGKLSIKKFIDYFMQGKFKDLVFEDFMRQYFKDELITNRELKEKEEFLRAEYFNSIIERTCEFERGISWFKAALNQKKYGYSTFIKEYNANSKELNEKLYLTIKALSKIKLNSDKLEPLPIFSSRITKDPHFFDIGTSSFNLFMCGLCYYLNIRYPKNVEEINEVLYAAGIARDELSIFTTVYGISAYNNEVEHEGWKGFYDRCEPLHVSIKNLNNVDKLKFNDNKVFIFENPTVFSEVINNIEKRKKPLVCTGGQLNSASFMLLDRLIKYNVILYYSGDFDPEGLMIADKLKCRYKDKLVLWRYTIEDYLKIKGNKNFKGRESKFLKLESKELLAVKEEMEKDKMCGYQELLIESYVKDIIENN
ncbi:DUF2399 domain-containing protein [Clostridium arbusti]|uniref:DUF2399 domain-containing protein n=1 Tax=Clostridium arbusti TaxID=1137848 RepID=UPI0002889C28|nr:DUF2399 domain-containing protein [Clostridium arbusti]